MGDTKVVLAEATLEPRSVTPNQIWVDLCENLHIHFRNTRFDMSKKEFAEYMCAMNCLYKAAEYAMNEWEFKEGDPNVLKQLQFKTPISHNSDYYTNRFVLEWNRDDTFHMHYRDFRLHMTMDEFEDIAKCFVKALEIKNNHIDFEKMYGPFNGEAKRIKVNIEHVQPYDAGHKPGGKCFDAVLDDATKSHEDGIARCMKLIESGEKIMPILVAKNGQRLDGFKRYMAFKRLGHKEIEVIVDPFGKMGGQHNADFVEKEELVS